MVMFTIVHIYFLMEAVISNHNYVPEQAENSYNDLIISTRFN